MNINIDSNVFNKAYLPYVFNYSHKIEVYMGGAGSGKSHFVAQKIMIKALKSKRKILVVRKVGATIRDSVWQMLIDTISFFKIYDQCKINKTDFSIQLPNGSCFLFKGMEDDQKIKSIAGLTDCWIEEATELRREEYDQLKLRVRAKTENNQIWLSYNPINRENWVYDSFHNEETRDTKAFVLKTTYLDNDFLPQDYIDSLLEMKNNNPYYYQVYAMGEFGVLGKTIYNNWKTEKTEKLNIEELLKGNLVTCAGLDFGFNHPYAVCISLVDEANKTIYVIDEIYQKNKTNSDIYKLICDKGYGRNTFICDSASPRDIEELRRLGLRVRRSKKGKNSVFNGITRIQDFQIVIDESCENFVKEITTYSWKKDKNGNYQDEPVKIGDDLMDAWRYSLEDVLRGKGKMKTYNKGKLGLGI